MPNWCECELKVTAKKNKLVDINNFKTFASGKDDNDLLSSENFVPYPKERVAIEKKRQHWIDNNKDKNEFDCPTKDWFNTGGYEWCSDEWGTKWGICEVSVLEETKTKIQYLFSCAWSPPIPIVIAMAKKFPELKFTLDYWERGCGFQGKLICSNGKVLANVSKGYKGNRGG